MPSPNWLFDGPSIKVIVQKITQFDHLCPSKFTLSIEMPNEVISGNMFEIRKRMFEIRVRKCQSRTQSAIRLVSTKGNF